jgi:hypothetical protein
MLIVRLLLCTIAEGRVTTHLRRIPCTHNQSPFFVKRSSVLGIKLHGYVDSVMKMSDLGRITVAQRVMPNASLCLGVQQPQLDDYSKVWVSYTATLPLVQNLIHVSPARAFSNLGGKYHVSTN